MKKLRALALLGIMALTTVSAGCARLALIFQNSDADTDATAEFTVTDADTSQVLAQTTLTASNQSIVYCLKAGKAPRNLVVDVLYDDDPTDLNPPVPLSTAVTLGKWQTQYVIVDNVDPANPTIRVSATNDSGVPVSNCCIPLK